jgi:hypothetical protein
MSKIKVGDQVRFTSQVVSRSGNRSSESGRRALKARGLVTQVRDGVISVDFEGTWIPHENGGTVRHLPEANLRLVG